jgi:hypothetical protein
MIIHTSLHYVDFTVGDLYRRVRMFKMESLPTVAWCSEDLPTPYVLCTAQCTVQWCLMGQRGQDGSGNEAMQWTQHHHVVMQLSYHTSSM